MLGWIANLNFAASAVGEAPPAPASHGTFLMAGTGQGCFLLPFLAALLALGVR